MAIATGTATLIAAGAGLAATGVTTGMSFTQANKQKKLQKEAEAEADKAMAKARASLEVNYMDALSIQKEPYELQREAMISQGTQATDAAQESERGAAAGAGRVQMAQNEAQGAIRTDMGKELTEIQRLKVAEDARLRDLNVQLDLGEVEGAQMAARNAQEMAAQATAQGFEGVTSMATQAANLVPLYAKSGADYTVNNGNNATSNFDKNSMSPISGAQNNINYMSPAYGFGFGTLPTTSSIGAFNQSFGNQMPTTNAMGAFNQSFGNQKQGNLVNPFLLYP
jgi:vacuolar-type H+-ATPase subunit H